VKRIFCLTLFSINVSSCQTMPNKMIVTKPNGEKVYYINTAGGPNVITTYVTQKKYILIDEFKTWNPHPIPLTDSDCTFIKNKLPEWMTQHYKLPDAVLSELENLPLKDIHPKYIFTHFSVEEEDIYLLKLKYDDKEYRIYIGKRPFNYVGIVDGKSKFEKNKLMYPFYDEEWNLNFYETKEEYLKMRKIEEDGYNEHFK
jgi:hypothetical protein